ncbi:RidA family protein [Paenibacillus sp. GP183]|uniref:RidA family protein n=1 Tax=Paenibacillus sp. GP183 TaxID=1882751 RepID=UPI000894BBD0|nr:RidA family protein [Paenibacillus sp. GP183]SEB52034.1 reactive intermediate/imine deaminase [Paenibacillus sp. GP183]
MAADKLVTFINPDTMPKPNGYTNVVEVRSGRTIYIAGQVALNREGQVVGIGDLAAQTKQVFENIKSALEATDAAFDEVVKLTYFITDISQFQVVRDIRDTYINTSKPPAGTVVEVSGLFREQFLIEIEAIAVSK